MQNIQNIVDKLVLYLLDKEWFSSEAASEELGIDRTKILQAIHLLRISEGWSIIECNHMAYARRIGLQRDRKKKERYRHDQYEEDWNRTSYKVLKHGKSHYEQNI